MVTDDPARQWQIVREALARAERLDFTEPPPVLARELHARVRKLCGAIDPYRRVKDESTRIALQLLPALRREVARAADPFAAAVRLAIAGNVIDFGTNRDLKLDQLQILLRDALRLPLSATAVARLRHAMDAAESILFLGDNCGEIVLDRLLLEPYRHKLTFVVRGGPILNDATLADAAASGLTDLVPVISTGDAAPGVILKHCSAEFRARFAAADLVIAKGQGNFETLDGESRRIFFLLKAKCGVVARRLRVPLGSLVVTTTPTTRHRHAPPSPTPNATLAKPARRGYFGKTSGKHREWTAPSGKGGPPHG